MNILVFSDTHLGSLFEEKKFNFLSALIDQVDRVIINGDFWEGYGTSFDRFVNSPWKQLFPKLKAKQAIYIFGNHDRQILSDKRTALFSKIQTDRFALKPNGTRFIFEHGHRLCPIMDEPSPPSKRLVVATYLTGKAEEIMTITNNKAIKRFLLGKYNNIIKRKLKKELSDNEVLICGHTHLSEFNIKERFVNTGIVRHGLAQYLLIQNGHLYPKEEWYE